MKNLIVALALVTSVACSVRPVDGPQLLPGIPLDIDPSVAIFTAEGEIGHGCPVQTPNGVMVFTAAHVLRDAQGQVIEYFSWSSGSKSGTGQFLAFAYGYDLASVLLLDDNMEGQAEIRDAVRGLPLGTVKPGDRVFWFEYDFRTVKNAMRARRRFGDVLRKVAGYYVMDSTPVAGASGSCAINKRGEVVGLVVWGFETDDGGLPGMIVSLPEP